MVKEKTDTKQTSCIDVLVQLGLLSRRNDFKKHVKRKSLHVLATEYYMQKGVDPKIRNDYLESKVYESEEEEEEDDIQPKKKRYTARINPCAKKPDLSAQKMSKGNQRDQTTQVQSCGNCGHLNWYNNFSLNNPLFFIFVLPSLSRFGLGEIQIV